jgi:hypothetical protein
MFRTAGFSRTYPAQETVTHEPVGAPGSETPVRRNDSERAPEREQGPGRACHADELQAFADPGRSRRVSADGARRKHRECPDRDHPIKGKLRRLFRRPANDEEDDEQELERDRAESRGAAVLVPRGDRRPGEEEPEGGESDGQSDAARDGQPVVLAPGRQRKTSSCQGSRRRIQGHR